MSDQRKRILVTLIVLIACLAFVAPSLSNSSPYGQVTEMRLWAQPNNWTGPCPATINFNGFIRVDGPNTVTYGITRSDGGKGKGPQTLRFTGAGRKPVHFTWRLGKQGENYDGWVEIGSGNTRSNRAEFHLHCR